MRERGKTDQNKNDSVWENSWSSMMAVFYNLL